MKDFSASPREVAASIWRNRNLISAATKREVMVVATLLGVFPGYSLVVLQPLLMLAVYTFVFSVVFKARWGGSESKTEFALVLFAGMIVFNLFSECINRAPNLIWAIPIM